MKEFRITVLCSGVYFVENPSCPSDWRGSGVYDQMIDCHRTLVFEVSAPDRTKAVSMAEDAADTDERFRDCRTLDVTPVENEDEWSIAFYEIISEEDWKDGPAEFPAIWPAVLLSAAAA